MFDFFKKSIPSLNDIQVKSMANILIIDDEEPVELRTLLNKEGWKNYYLNDLDALSNRKLVDCHVVCIDIMGVGKKLQESSGIGLVKHIKERYPAKKIILYSSVSNHDIFEDSLDYVDKKIRKQTSLVPFILAIEEMAKNTLSWDEAVRFSYNKVKAYLPPESTFDNFREAADKAYKKGSFSKSTFGKNAGVAFDVSAKVASLVSLAM